MPFGISFTVPNDSPAILAIHDWIAAGAKNDEDFKTKILPLFETDGAFGPNRRPASNCHMSNQEPPSFHELNLGTYEGIMLGADSVAKGVANATKVVIPGKPERKRVPAPGRGPHAARHRPDRRSRPSQHPDPVRWIEQGAKCD